MKRDLTHAELMEARDMLNILNGKGAGGMLNYAAGDPYYAKSIERKFGMPVEELHRHLKEKGVADD
jgi:hypothetical protein